MHPSRLVLFDIDGTLLHSAGCGHAATELAIKEVFGTLGTLDLVSFAGRTDWGILLDALQSEGITAEQVRDGLSRYDRVLSKTISRIIGDFPVRPCPGAPDVVAALRHNPNVMLGLVTGNMEGIVGTKLHAAGYDPFDFKIGAFGSEGWKRSMLPPLAVERAEALSGAQFSGKQIVVIGDTPEDIACAASVSGRTIAVATGPFTTDQLRPHQPDFLFETLADTDSVLAAILDDLDEPGSRAH
jgi:phosphoglycolate phosphatase